MIHPSGFWFPSCSPIVFPWVSYHNVLLLKYRFNFQFAHFHISLEKWWGTKFLGLTCCHTWSIWKSKVEGNCFFFTFFWVRFTAIQNYSWQHCVLTLGRCITETSGVEHFVICSVVAPRRLWDTSLTVSFVYSTYGFRINEKVQQCKMCSDPTLKNKVEVHPMSCFLIVFNAFVSK